MMKIIEEITAATNEGATGTTNIAESTGVILEKISEIAVQTENVRVGSTNLAKAVEKFRIQ